jgi:phosphoglycolate phosphatase
MSEAGQGETGRLAPAPKTAPARKIDAILFDFDGTLADTLPCVAEALTALAGRRIVAADVAPLRSAPQAAFLARCAEAFPELAGQDDLAFWFGEAYRTATAVPRAAPGLNSAIFHLALGGARRLGVVSDKPEDALAFDVRRAVALSRRFRAILGHDGVRPSKPDPTALLGACAVLGVDPANALYVGDTDTDAEAARAAGITYAGVEFGWAGHRIYHAQPAYPVLHDLARLPQLVAHLEQSSPCRA